MRNPVVLLQPPGTCSDFTRSRSVYPPLGLCQLAATVPPEDVAIVDADAHSWDEATTWDRVRALAPSAVGLTVTTYSLALVERYAAGATALGVPAVIGGPHATLAPYDVLRRCPSVKWVVRGEGEAVFPALVRRLREGKSPLGLPGVVGRAGTLGVIGGEAPRVEDFTALPFPHFEGLPLDRYWCPDARQRPMVTFMTARGCPHRCGFCSSPNLLGKKVRGFSVDRVLDELEHLVRDLGVREISFVDDVFTIQRKRTIALCLGMVERGLGLSWFCNARADQVTPEMADAMAAAGCHQVYLGFESGSQAILDRIQKGATVADLEHGAAILRAAGIGRSVGFVFGLPGESDETVAESIELARRVMPERVQFTRFTPLVGSPLFDEAPLPGHGRGFHEREDDQVDAWIRTAYEACRSAAWGQSSL